MKIYNAVYKNKFKTWKTDAKKYTKKMLAFNF